MCLSPICLSMSVGCISQRNTCPNFTKFSLRLSLPVTMTRSSSGVDGIRYVHPVLWMTSYFHIIEPTTPCPRQRGLRKSFVQGLPGTESAIHHCCLVLFVKNNVLFVNETRLWVLIAVSSVVVGFQCDVISLQLARRGYSVANVLNSYSNNFGKGSNCIFGIFVVDIVNKIPILQLCGIRPRTVRSSLNNSTCRWKNRMNSVL